MSSTVVISTGYEPRPHQAYLHKHMRRFNVLVIHRRFGKTVLCLNEIVDRGLQNPLHRPQYAYIAPTYGQAKKVAWEELKKFTRMLPGVQYHETELKCTIKRPAMGDEVVIYLMGAENYDAIRGMYLDGVVLDESADINPEIWGKVIRPLLQDRKGWAIFVGTPKGQNHFYEWYQRSLELGEEGNWFGCLMKASETGVFTPEELEELKQDMSESEYEQEFECSFAAALTGAYYGKELEKLEHQKKLMTVPYDPALPVYTGWDLGLSDTTTIWFVQQHRFETRVIDYIENSGAGLDWYVKEINAKGYNIKEHFLPHDVRVRELTSGKSRLEALRQMGLKNVRVVAKLPVADGINAVRMLLPKCVFDREKCKRGIDALKNYERKWDSKNKIYQQTPNHNWASHGADGFRTLAVGLREDYSESNDTRRYPRQSQGDFDVV